MMAMSLAEDVHEAKVAQGICEWQVEIVLGAKK